MQTISIGVTREQAKLRYQDYKKHLHYSTPMDDEIRLTYQRIAQGKTVIKALESITAAGLKADGLPHLALARADMPLCRLRTYRNASFSFTSLPAGAGQWDRTEARDRLFSFPENSLPGIKVHPNSAAFEAIVPTIPVNLRPRRGLANYHILFEAEWTRTVPIDPILLRRIGRGDLWLVCAAWDLSEVERAALAARL